MYWYENFVGDLEVAIKGSDESLRYFKKRFLVQDINGEFLYPGDEIQGYNNKKHTSDKIKLYKTGVMEVKYPDIWKLIHEDTFEFNERYNQVWFWKV